MLQATSAAAQLLHIGAVQFGRFEIRPGQFEPVLINLPMLASYPATLRALAAEVAPLVRAAGQSHLLAMPAALPLGVAVALEAEIPLVYPSADGEIEGAYDYNVPTVLLSAALRDGEAEEWLIREARRHGLDVEAVVSVFDLGWRESLRGANGPLSVRALWTLETFVQERADLPPGLRAAVIRWLHPAGKT